VAETAGSHRQSALPSTSVDECVGGGGRGRCLPAPPPRCVCTAAADGDPAGGVRRRHAVADRAGRAGGVHRRGVRRRARARCPDRADGRAARGTPPRPRPPSGAAAPPRRCRGAPPWRLPPPRRGTRRSAPTAGGRQQTGARGADDTHTGAHHVI